MLAMVISINGKEELVAGEATCELLTADVFAMRSNRAYLSLKKKFEGGL